MGRSGRLSFTRWSRRLCLLMLGLLVISAETNRAQAIDHSGLAGTAARLSAKLGIQKNVGIVVAERNDRMVSVEPVQQPDDTFIVTFDREFLSGLDEGEIAAAIAHEIGHIWIFCHFPYLHTEVLANEIALNAVERVDLESLYTKLRGRIGSNQTVEEFLARNLPARNARLVKVVE